MLDPAPVLAHLARCPRHAATPLLRRRPGGRPLWLKDERDRMGLGSFKALGGAYAVLRLIERHGPDVTFVCASAGNHGLSVAAGARIFGARARIHLAATVPEPFADRLRGEGPAHATTTRWPRPWPTPRPPGPATSPTAPGPATRSRPAW